jgi:cytochrome oxidase assembly protein ShyY1
MIGGTPRASLSVVGSWRFLLSRRWILFAVFIIIVVYGTWLLGRWQFHRLDERHASNAIITRNENAPVVQAGTIMSPTTEVTDQQDWRRVTATGHYDTGHTTIIRYRADVHGASGVDIVLPFVTKSGVIAVDRGWMYENDGTASPSEAPAPPSGTVTITGYLREDATGSSTDVTEMDGGWTSRTISGVTLGQAWGLPVAQGFVMIQNETPAPSTGLEHTALPTLGDGPHFFYGLQWWFFGILGATGFFYFGYDEWRRRTGRLPEKGADDDRGPDADEQLPMPAGGTQQVLAREREAPTTVATTAPPELTVGQQARLDRRNRKARRRAAIEAGLEKARAEKAARR